MSDKGDWIEEAIANRNLEYFAAEELKDMLEERGVEVDGNDVMRFVGSPVLSLDPDEPLGDTFVDWLERFDDALNEVDVFRIVFQALVEYRLGHTVRL